MLECLARIGFAVSWLKHEQQAALKVAAKVYQQKNVFDPVAGRYCDDTQEERFQQYVLTASCCVVPHGTVLTISCASMHQCV